MQCSLQCFQLLSLRLPLLPFLSRCEHLVLIHCIPMFLLIILIRLILDILLYYILQLIILNLLIHRVVLLYLLLVPLTHHHYPGCQH